MRTACSIVTLVALGLFIVSGMSCAAGGGGGGGGGPAAGSANGPCLDDGTCNGNLVCNSSANTCESGAGDGDSGDGDGQGDDQGQSDDQGEGEGDGDGPTEDQALIKTQISAGLISGALVRIQAGDDLVVFETSETSTDMLAFIVPTQSDSMTNSASEIPGGTTLYGVGNWIVVGKKVALVRSNNTVAIYDTTTPSVSPVDLSAGEITLAPLPTAPYQAGHMTSDGQFIAVLTDMFEVDDGNAIKVIDVSGATAEITSFPNPEEPGSPVQVAVNADSRQVAAYWGNSIYVFDIDDPATGPLVFTFNLGSPLGDFHAQNPAQMQFDGPYILYRASSEGTTSLLNTVEGTVTNLTADAEFSMTLPVAMNGQSFLYFPSSESVDQIFSGATVTRSAIGTTIAPASLTLADQLGTIEVTRSDCLDGREQGKIGYGSKMAITPDGEQWFISGEGAVDEDIDYLQMSVGGEFSLFEDPEDESHSGYVMASDVSASANTVAFWTLRQTPGGDCLAEEDWVVGFIVLDRL